LFQLSVDQPFANSDHNTVNFTLTAAVENTQPVLQPTKKYLWTNADYPSMVNYLYGYDWYALLSVNLTPDDIWNAFCGVVNDTIDMFVPFTFIAKTTSRHTARPKAKVYPVGIIQLQNHKRKLWRRCKDKSAANLPQLINEYREACQNCGIAIRQYEVQIERDIISSNNLGQFYKYINGKLTCHSGIGTLLNSAGDVVTNDEDKANLLNDYFSSVWTNDDGQLPAFCNRTKNNASIDSVSFTADSIYAAARNVKPKTTKDPDGFSSVLMVKLIPALCIPLALIFSSFLSVGKVPSSWKCATVTPIFKKGLASDTANYRPISVTSVFGKLMERVIASHILQYLNKSNLIHKDQHGFLSGKSTTTNLLESVNDWTIAIDNKNSVTVAYVDFAKAFDSVSHPKLFHKLKAYGITGNLLAWIEDLLTGRTQRVKVGIALSLLSFIRSGVIQGSSIGFLLFLMFINDLIEIFENEVRIKMFADDLKIYTVITTSSDENMLQQNLNRLSIWATEWQLPIAIRKCHILQIGRCLLDPFEFSIDQTVIDPVLSISDLGVTVDQTLTFWKHIQTITSKAHARANLIIRCFISRDTHSLINAFKVYVRPLLEYCSTVWSPYTLKGISAVEQVQRRFTKRLRGMYWLSYTQRLEKLNLETLELRRLRADLILTYKIVFGITHINAAELFTLTNNDRLRGHQYKLVIQRRNTDVRKYYFALRVVNSWNNLPQDKISFSNIINFKRSLKCVDLSKYLKYCTE